MTNIIYFGQPSQKLDEWCKANYSIKLFPKINTESFDLLEKEITRILNEPTITIDNNNVEDIVNTFNTIKTTFPISQSLDEPDTLEEMQGLIDTYVTEKNKIDN